MAADDDGVVVAWYDVRDGNGEIYLRRIDADGRTLAPERRVTETSDASYEPSLARLDDGLVLAWYEQTSGGAQTAMIGAWDRDGTTQKWMRAIASSSRNPVVRADGGAIVCAWIQREADGHEEVWAGWWNAQGHEQRARVRLGPASKDTWNLNVALDASGGAWVVFDDSTSTRASELFLARVESSVVRLDRLTRDDGVASKYPDVAIDVDGQAALTWYDMRDGNEEVYLYTSTASGLTGEIDERARRVTNTPGESIGAYLAWNGGRIGLAWSDKGAGSQHEVYFQMFDAGGAPLRDPVRITQNDTWSLIPAIRPWRNGFALAWNEYAPASEEIHEGTSEVAFTVVR